MVLFNPKLGGDKSVYAVSKSISPTVNARLEFKFASYDVIVQRFIYYATGTFFQRMCYRKDDTDDEVFFNEFLILEYQSSSIWCLTIITEELLHNFPRFYRYF